MTQANEKTLPRLEGHDLDTTEGCRDAYKAARYWAKVGQGLSYQDFDKLVAKALSEVENPAPRAYVFAAYTRTWKCGRCAGTGKYVTMVVNGKPTGPGGMCFRCEGHGTQTVADAHRNYWYDVKGRAYYV